jgi:hypothetical protein
MVPTQSRDRMVADYQDANVPISSSWEELKREACARTLKEFSLLQG